MESRKELATPNQQDPGCQEPQPPGENPLCDVWEEEPPDGPVPL